MAQIGELSEFVLDEAEEANDDVVDIKSVEGRFAGFSQSDISRMLENDGSDSSFETRTTVDQKGVKGWLQKMKTKLEKGITIDAKTRGLKALGYGMYSTCGSISSQVLMCPYLN